MGKRIKSWQDITVRAYVQGANGELIDVDTLTEEQRIDVATRLKCGWLNGMFDGKAVFTPQIEKEGETQHEGKNERTAQAGTAGNGGPRADDGGPGDRIDGDLLHAGTE